MAKNNEDIPLWQTGPSVEFVPPVKDKNEAQSLLINVRQNPGHEIAAGQLGHAIESRATRVLMDFTSHACSLRYQIDGSWEQLPPLDREAGDSMLHAVKQLCLMNPADRRNAQQGSCTVKLAKEKYELAVQSQGVKSGERVVARLTPEKLPFSSLSDLGMRDKMVENLKTQLNSEGNLVMITAPKGQGLTTTWQVAMDSADRFVRDFQSFEPEEAPEPEIININNNYFGGDTGRTETELVKKMILKEPDVLLFPNLPSSETMQIVMKQTKEASKQVMLRCVADSPLPALVQLLAKYENSSELIASQVGAVLGQRLVRRLCDNCKVGFEPPPQLLKQLGIPPGRVALLYQPFIPPPPEQQVDENGRPAPITPCHVCDGRGYMGRVAIFELLRPGEKLKEALAKTKDPAKLMSIAKAEGHRNIKAEAVLTVARGLTSLDELKRVFSPAAQQRR